MLVVALGLSASFIAELPRRGRWAANFKTGRRVSELDYTFFPFWEESEAVEGVFMPMVKTA